MAQTAPASPAATRGTGSVVGFVSNAATKLNLEGAIVTVAQFGITAQTDNSGRFVLTGLPPGTHTVQVSYTGLDPSTFQATVAEGQRTTRDIELTSGIYKLDAFKVTGEREGNALALTMQRNADNVKNVVAMDSFGNLPNMSVGEVVMRLPGVAPLTQVEGLNYAFMVRGMPGALNTVTMDGQRMPSIGTNRALELQSISSSLFEQMELVKGLTPDASADSLGGNLNMKSRSTLNLKEKRLVTFSSTVRAAAPGTEQIPLREKHRYHPLVTLAYQEVFSVLGGERNLGVNVNTFYSENAIGGIRVTQNRQNTVASPAYVWDYSYNNNFNNRKQGSVNLKTEYRYSFNSKFTFNAVLNQNHERMRRGYTMRAYTGNATAVPSETTTATGVVPGYTETFTRVRPLSTATYLSNVANNTVIDINHTGPNSYIVRQGLASFAGDHTYGPIKIDYNAGFSRNNLKTGMNNGGGKGGQYALTNRITGIGWTIDNSRSAEFPTFIQTAGPDIADPNNYRPIATGLTTGPQNQDQINKHINFDLIYTLPTPAKIIFKTGFTWRFLDIDIQNVSRRWSYTGASALPTDPSISLYGTFAQGKQMPVWQVSDFMADRVPKNPALWSEDLYYNEQLKYTGTRGVVEDITAGYGMFKGRFGTQGWLARTGFLAGVRQEKTETRSYGWVRQRFGSTAAQQVADPVGSAFRDYDGTKRNLTGSYTKTFPSVHLNHDITQNLKTRLSWSTGFGRAAPGNLMPNESINETNQTVTVNNPALLPQMASNWDATIEYYFEPMGSLTAGYFHKKITDYIVSGMDRGIVGTGNDNGFNGEYAGFRLLSSLNAGTATVSGWEIGYQQQFIFLPGLLKGLGFSANYTAIETEGDFGNLTGVKLKTDQVAGFVPKVGNVMLTWTYKGFRTRVLANYNSSYISTFNATNAGANLYRFSRTSYDVGFAQKLSRGLSVTLDISNFTKEPQSFYQYSPDRFQDYIQNFVTVTVGVSGRF
jgi:TonB-dependent receptor